MGRQRPWRFALPPEIADPYFMCELALELGMSLQDLGRRESNWNVCVTWPAFFAERARMNEIERARRAAADKERRSRI